MSEKEIVAKQIKFINWLQENGLYNPMDSSIIIIRTQAIWEKAIATECGQCYLNDWENYCSKCGHKLIWETKS